LNLNYQGKNMKTSVIEVHDMLAVLSVDEVEKRVGEVPGVESVTVNYAGGNATVRYDETRLQIGDVKSAVRQRGFESDAPASAGDGHEDHTAPGAASGTHEPAAPKGAADTSAPANDSAQQDQAAPPAAQSTPTAVAPEPSPVAPDTAPAGDEQQDKVAPVKS
jgi:Cu2+-exporting ATPase